jgi:MFS family permease
LIHSPPRSPSSPAALVSLMAAGMFINYVDRGSLSTVAPVLQDQLHLSSTQLGMLFSGFFVTYVCAMAPSGWLADRYGAKRVLAVSAAIWSAATLATGFASSFAMLLSLRLALGLGETAAFPSISKLIASTIQPSRIGLANGVIGSAYLVGPAVGTTAGGMLLAHFGWRSTFLVFGFFSLLWLLPWSRVVVPEPTAARRAAGEAMPSWRQILRQRALWGAAIGSFAGSYSYYALLAWLPTYLVKARGQSIEHMTAITASGYLFNAASALTFGWAIDRWVRSGRSPTTAWKCQMGLGYLVSAAAIVGFATLPLSGCVVCLCLAMVVSGCASVGYFAIPQLLAGPSAAARFVGLSNMCGNVAGIAGPAITGALIDATGGYGPAMACIGMVSILGIVGWVVVLPRVEPIQWAVAAGAPPAHNPANHPG